jgi:general secretion pathway protein C
MKAPAVRTIILRDRLAALTPRERVFVLVGAAALLLFLFWLLFWRGGDESEPVLLADSSRPPALSAPTIVQPSVVAPPPLLPVVPAPPLNAAPTQASAAALTLQGVSGGGPGGGAALIQYQTGSQRLVRVGREIVPGMVLTSVGPTYATANSGGGELRLALNRPGATPVVSAAAPASTSVPPPPMAQKREAMELRLGLEPIRANGRMRGYRVKPGPQVAILKEALLKPGDLLLSVGGVPLTSEAQLLRVPTEIGNAPVTITFERDGLNMTTSVSRLM